MIKCHGESRTRYLAKVYSELLVYFKYNKTNKTCGGAEIKEN